MAKTLQLRCQFGNGQRKMLVGLTDASSVTELQAAIFSVTEIQPNKQRIKSGFPPKLLDTSDEGKVLKESGLRSGDTLIIEEDKNGSSQNGAVSKSSTTAPQPAQQPPKSSTIIPQPTQQPSQMSSTVQVPTTPKMIRKIVPADNSCLFASISFVMLSDTSFASDLRMLAANIIAGDPETYNEVFLGKPNWEYCEWLTKKDHWGGAIELNVFSQHYQVEINAVDVQSGRIDRFGEDNHYPNRVFVMYDGIHYDPMGLEQNNTIVQTVFPSSDSLYQAKALEVASELKNKRQFTDLSGFSLRCLVCSTPLTGQTQAQQHAKETGHTNFGEV